MALIEFKDLPDTSTPINATNLNNNFKEVINIIYPVGSIYMSINSTNPTTLFGGTWERIQDKFLLSAGSTYSANSTGGSANHTLTTAELPKHTHTYSKSDTTSGSTALTIEQIPSHTHTFNSQGSNDISGYVAQAIQKGTNTLPTNATGGGKGHTHSISLSSASTNDGGFTNNSFSTLPPYLAVYMWKRIA